MSKRTAIAFFLSLLVIISYNYLMAKKYPQTEEQTALAPRSDNRIGLGLSSTPSTSQAPGSTPAAGLAVDTARQAEIISVAQQRIKQAKDVVVETDLWRLVLTSSGARIKSCQLKGYPEEKVDPSLLQQQIQGLVQAEERARPEARPALQRSRAKLEVLNAKIANAPGMVELVSLPATIDADFSPTIIFDDDEQTNVALNTGLYRCRDEGLSLNPAQAEGQLEFTYTTPRGQRIKKIYSFSNYNYIIGLEIYFQGWVEQDLPRSRRFYVFCGPDVGMPQAQAGGIRGRGMSYQGPVSGFQTGQQAWAEKEKYARNEQDIFVRHEHKQKGQILWTGLQNKYFLFAIIPQLQAESVVIEKNRFGEQKAGLRIPWGDSPIYNFSLYLGPKKAERLKQAGATLEKSIDYGFFGPIARFIYQALVFFSGWTHNFGWAIVLLCIATKIIFYPLTHHSFESMQKMQQQMKSVQPEMDALRQEHKDNPQKLNKEVMALYRRRGVNPLASCQSGCLPLLLQMPVFFALYSVLYNAIELRGAPFLGWVTDLSAKDPYYILPVLMGISMFVQQKVTGLGAAGASGAQQQQAKMMAFIMPVFLVWIFARLPSGVVLYWFTFNIATALQQALIKKKQQTHTRDGSA